MQDDLLQMGRYLTFAVGGTFSDLLTTNHSFATSPELAKLYGVTPWDGTSEPPQFPAGQRPGFLTRAAFLTSGMVNTRPIIKGVYIRRYRPARPFARPAHERLEHAHRHHEQEQPPGRRRDHRAGTEHPAPPATRRTSTRWGLRPRTSTASDGCAPNSPCTTPTGTSSPGIPIDTNVVPRIVSGDDWPATGMADVVNMINESAKAQACFVRNYFRFTFRRMDDPVTDGCALEQLRQKLMSGTLAEAFRDVALTDQFRSRHFE